LNVEVEGVAGNGLIGKLPLRRRHVNRVERLLILRAGWLNYRPRSDDPN
jgi:hypothetical protein